MYTIFPAARNKVTRYYACDFAEPLGTGGTATVYKGYECKLIKPNLSKKPFNCKPEEIKLDRKQPVAVKRYNRGEKVSIYQEKYGSYRVLHAIEDAYVLVTDYFEGDHLKPTFAENAFLQDLTFLETVDLAWQLIMGLSYFHQHNLVHGDIKGENILIHINKLQDIDFEKIKLIEVYYIDIDKAKPILEHHRQKSEGTSQHLAPETLEGYYSQASDFYALAPLLLSIFGAANPFQAIFDFEETNPGMTKEELVTNYCKIGFCKEGLFEKFKAEEKVYSVVYPLLADFISQMTKPNRHARPSPEAVLEFFTALRQWCLVEKAGENDELYLVRMHIAAKNNVWLENKRYSKLLIASEDMIQARFVNLLDLNLCMQLYNNLDNKEQADSLSLCALLRKKIAEHLSNKSLPEKASLPKSIFSKQVTNGDLHWLLACVENADSNEFYAPKNARIRDILTHCKDKELAPLISILVEGFKNPATPSVGRSFN